MDDRFFTAFFPAEAIICGRRLKAFSTYHFLILASIDSPFFSEDGDITPKDLLAAVKICGQRYGSAPDLAPTLRDHYWRRKLTRDPRLFRDQCKAFHLFMNEHSSVPQFWDVVEGGQSFRELTGPSALIPIVSSMIKLGFTEAQAWDMSMGKLQWYCAEASEIDGSERRFLDENDLAATEAALREAEEQTAIMTDDQARAMFAVAYEGEDLEQAMKQWREGKEKLNA